MQSNLFARLMRPRIGHRRCARRMNTSPASVRLNDAVLQTQAGFGSAFGGNHARVPHGQHWIASPVRLIVVVTLRSAWALAARLHRRRNCCHRSHAGQRATLACRRIGGITFPPRTQADDRHNHDRGGRFSLHHIRPRCGPVIDNRFQGHCRRRPGTGNWDRQESWRQRRDAPVRYRHALYEGRLCRQGWRRSPGDVRVRLTGPLPRSV